jgi:hypothetical protein
MSTDTEALGSNLSMLLGFSLHPNNNTANNVINDKFLKTLQF